MGHRRWIEPGAKRLLDVLLAMILLPLAAPIVLAGALLVRLRSPGPAFVRQLREGRDGRPFAMLKLRTMFADAPDRLAAVVAGSPALRDEWARYRCLRHDPRVVPVVGHALRRSSVDELPQLWNVLRGEMSIVGPRPLELDVVPTLPVEAVATRRRVRPGMTGLWQVSGRSEHDLHRLCALDVRYVEAWSLRLDVAILLRTPAAVLGGRGAV